MSKTELSLMGHVFYVREGWSTDDIIDSLVDQINNSKLGFEARREGDSIHFDFIPASLEIIDKNKRKTRFNYPTSAQL